MTGPRRLGWDEPAPADLMDRLEPRRRPGPKGPRRPQVAVRLAPAGIATVDELAQQAGVNRSEMVRRLLAAAVTDPRIRARVVDTGAPTT